MPTSTNQAVKPPIQPLLLSLRDAAPLLAITYKTARTWLSQGRLPVPTYLIGGKRIVKLADIETYVESLGKPEQDPEAHLSTQPNSGPPRRGRGRPRLSVRPRQRGGI